MQTQLTLLEAGTTWRLDERTRDLGRRRVAEARAALRAAGGDRQDEEPADDAGHKRSAA